MLIAIPRVTSGFSRGEEEGAEGQRKEKGKTDQICNNLVELKYGRLLPFSLSVCSTTFNKPPSDVNGRSGRQHRTGSPTNGFFFFLIQIT